MSLFFVTPSSRRRTGQDGFALVIALSLMAFVLLLILSLTTLIRVETQSAEMVSAQVEAEQTALLGLQVALGELQKAAGPDQRVTATAEVLNDATNIYTGGIDVPAGQGSWTGVWKSDTVSVGTPSYDPTTPNARSFIGWLVSGTDTNGNFALPTTLAQVATDVGTAGMANGIPNYVTLFKRSDGTPYSQVEKVRVASDTSGDRYFAFHVDDEAVKADLSWSETPAVGAGSFAQSRAQARRLSAVPGPDFGALNGGDDNGPFGSVTYPLSIDSSALLTDVLKIQAPTDLTVTMSDSTEASKWLKGNRADMTWGSRGVMADVKWGGLRRDLSLAFEMDGDADVTASEQPSKFNRQVGEFVGGADRLAAAQAALGMNGVKERFLYQVTQSDGTPFSGDLQRADSVVRGPNWWALRDYANLYKRLEGSGGDYSLAARSYYPNVSAAGNKDYHLGFMFGRVVGKAAFTWDSVITHNGSEPYIFKPARANYAPVLLGNATFYSALAVNPTADGVSAELALGIDPFFFLWNPYNRKLTFDRYALRMTTLPGHITFWVTKSDGSRERHGPVAISRFLAVQAGATVDWDLTYLVSDLTLEPGEVVVVSPGSNRDPADANEYHDNAFPGTNTNNASGAILAKMPNEFGKNWQTVQLDLATDQVEFLLSNNINATVGGSLAGKQTNAELFWINSYIAPPNTKAIDLADASNPGDHIQQIGGNVGGRHPVEEYFDPPRLNVGQPLPNPTGMVNANTLVSAKTFFGATCFLTKPSNHGGDYRDNVDSVVEVFTQFNPFPVGGYNDIWRPCHLSQVFSSIADPSDIETLMLRSGINFPGSLPNNAYWGESYEEGSTSIPMLNIPSAPILSMASFSHANLTIGTQQPFRAVGNSWASVFISPDSPYGELQGGWQNLTGSDASWLLNDSLFDRYYLSGMATDFTIGGGGYSPVGTLSDTLNDFFSADYQAAQANPVVVPYLPDGALAADVVAALAADDGYKKMAAYSLIHGAFNVNSTSVAAWEAFLGGNRNLSVDYAQNGGSDSANGTPFPQGTSPSAPENGADTYWSGFSRLTDSQITRLAEEIVEEVKLRGPFMSLADFVNHRVGSPKNNATHYMGALQAAIEGADINAAVKAGAGGVTPAYGALAAYMPDVDPNSTRVTSTGIATDITQADLLLPLAPRLTARADTFRIRAYGEVRSKVGSEVSSQAVCEAVVQRIPEYVDPDTDPTNNEPWDEATDPLNPSASTLNASNQQFGRRFKIVSFRWLASDEI